MPPQACLSHQSVSFHSVIELNNELCKSWWYETVYTRRKKGSFDMQGAIFYWFFTTVASTVLCVLYCKSECTFMKVMIALCHFYLLSVCSGYTGYFVKELKPSDFVQTVTRWFPQSRNKRLEPAANKSGLYNFLLCCLWPMLCTARSVKFGVQRT